MRILQGKVTDGRIELEDEMLVEGKSVTVLLTEDEGFFLTEAEEDELLAAMAEAEAGQFISGEEMLAQLAAMRHASH